MIQSGRRRDQRRVSSLLHITLALFLLIFVPSLASAQIGVELRSRVPGWFDADEDLRLPKPYSAFGVDSLAQFNHEAIIFRMETELDSARGYYISTRSLFGREFGRPIVESRVDYRNYRFERDRKQELRKTFFEEVSRPTRTEDGDAIEIQVPFKIRNKTFRRIFGGDRVGLRVSGKINIEGGLRREKSDEVVTVQNDRANYNFKIDQTQQFRIVGKVGDKVSVEIDQDSESVFEFENNVRLEYTGYEDEIIQSIEAGNVSLSLPGTQLATMSSKNEGLFGFKTVSRMGPLSVTTIASLQKGEKNKLSYSGGSESQSNEINDAAFMDNQYFFLDLAYRQAYANYTSDLNFIASQPPIERLEVYRSVFATADVSTFYNGWAVYDESLQNSGYVPDLTGATVEEITAKIEEYNNDPVVQSADWAGNGFFKKLVEGVDYDLDLNLGYIRLKYRAQNTEIIGVAYRVQGESRTVGTLDPQTKKVVLKLLKPKSENANNPTWDLSWKHVYWMGTTGLKADDFNFNLVRNNTERSRTDPMGKSWLEIFGLDTRGTDGSSAPDGLIDEQWVRYNYGEIHFPDLRPFDPAGYTVGGNLVEIEIDTSLANPDIYDPDPQEQVTLVKNFMLQAEYSNASANINLGINVLPGSEEVFINGSSQTKDTDYIIDYLSGQITILNQAAFGPNANLEIKYESGEVFQLDQRTMIGIRLEYALWESSYIGLTLLNFNEKPIEKRVKVGNEPLQNFIWDLNTSLKFHPYFMTQMVNAIPFINTDEPSEVRFEGEIAQVFPNPNSLNNSSTGDNDGVAYIDDFEAAQRATPFSVRRKNWYPASHPVRLPSGRIPSTSLDDYDLRSRIYWYNPFKQVPITDIWPNREVNSNVPNNTDVLILQIDPTVNNLRSSEVEPQQTWNGVMRSLSAGFHNQSNAKFVEIWMKWDGGGSDASFYLDIGQISEDYIPNNELDTEDEPLFETVTYGNDILDDGEDVGLDGRNGNDPPWEVDDEPWTVEGNSYDFTSPQYDWWDLNGNNLHDQGTIGNPEDKPEPFSTDNWRFSAGNSSDVDQINGTEDNAQDEARYPDTEDLDGDLNLNLANNFYRYQFRLNKQEDEVKYIRGGQANSKGWRLIRIPIDDIFDEINDPDRTQIEFVRLWVGELSTPLKLQIAQLELVGNEWLEDLIISPVTGDTTVYITASTINTYDNPEDYDPPPGVAGQVDPITNIRSKEQSLVLNIGDMPSATEGQLIKSLHNNQDLREYRQLKMFVHGGGRNPQSLNDKNLEFFLRFGSGFEGANLGYYEYSLPIEPGWADNEILINLDRLTSLKKKAEEAGEDIAYETLANGHSMKVVGSPSIGSVDVYAVGVRNTGRSIQGSEGIEVWVDELRLSGVRRERGMAMRSSLDIEFADFLDLNINVKQSDAEFHQVDQRSGTDRSSLESTVSGSIQLHQFLDPALGYSLPVRGTVSSTLDIPKYTSGNGDVRTESLVESRELNVWSRYAEMAFSKRHFEDKYLRGADGGLVINELNGIPLQDRSKWGVDTLFTTSQNYSWSINASKNRESGHWLSRYTLDNISSSYSRGEKYSSSLSYQYQKTFTNRGDVSYSLPIERRELDIFGWTEKIPILNRLADSKFSYLPTRFNAGLDATETQQSQKYRNSLERPSYKLQMSRDWSTGINPFRPLTMDYSYSVSSQMVPEDSARQKILREDQPLNVVERLFEPGLTERQMVELLIDQLRQVDAQGAPIFGVQGGIIAVEAENRLNSGEDPGAILEYIYHEAELSLSAYQYSFLSQPWDRVSKDDQRFKDTFWTAFNMPFADTQKRQTVRLGYSPSIVSWLTTGIDYSTAYNWTWSGFSNTQRSISTNNNLSGNLTFRLRQIIPAESGSGSVQEEQARDFARMLGREDEFERLEGEDGEEVAVEGEGEEDTGPTDAELSRARQRALFRALNPYRLSMGFLRKMQDITFRYSQTTSFSNPGVDDGTPDMFYRLGLTGHSGLTQVPGVTSIQTSNRSDDYTVRSGIDWTTRLNTSMDYSLKISRSTGTKVSGSTTKSSFFLFNKDKKSFSAFDIPNYQLRWSGIEQFGPLKDFAQTITFDHSYSGDYSESWDNIQRTPEEGGGIERVIQRKTYDKRFSPLAGFNITWNFGISTTARYTWSQQISETPSHGGKTRNTTTGISLTGNYTRKTGFRIPIPVWPFKNKRFDNETTFSFSYDQSGNTDETLEPGFDFEITSERSNWSIGPSISYRFSRNVNGAIHYKYGVTKTKINTTRFQEFGLNISITIRG